VNTPAKDPTLTNVLETLLRMDLTYEHSDDIAARDKGYKAAESKKEELKTLSDSERDWLLSELLKTWCAYDRASLVTACWILWPGALSFP